MSTSVMTPCTMLILTAPLSTSSLLYTLKQDEVLIAKSGTGSIIGAWWIAKWWCWILQHLHTLCRQRSEGAGVWGQTLGMFLTLGTGKRASSELARFLPPSTLWKKSYNWRAFSPFNPSISGHLWPKFPLTLQASLFKVKELWGCLGGSVR